jgi:Flp pilus assembly pilin Flp
MQSPDAVAALMRDARKLSPKSEEGQDLLEYGLLAALIAIFALGAVAALGQSIYTVFWKGIAASF